MKALDTSRYATDNLVPPPAFYQRCVADGVGLFVPGAWHGSEAYDAVKGALFVARTAYSLKTATYTALTPSVSGVVSVQKAHTVCDTEWPFLRFVAVDIEIDGITLKHISDAVEEVVRLGQRPIIYTSASRWTDITGNTTDFRWVRLWNADYNGIPELFFEHPYGGWQNVYLAGEQYTGSTSYGGIDVDFNVFDDNFVNDTPLPPILNPLQALADAWKKDCADLASNAISVAAPPLDITRLAYHTIYTDARFAAWKALLAGSGK